ncbi:LamG domain-containing protein, partial [Leptolyngbya cf. ectocarpi LEGE 11479]
MTVQPKYHWQFNERQGTTTVDAVSGDQSRLSKATLKGHGRIGNAIHLVGGNAHVNLGKEVGQFGTSDFTVAFGMRSLGLPSIPKGALKGRRKGGKVIVNFKKLLSELDIIGDQVMQGHGNFFSVRLMQGRIFFHVDENSKAKHYVKVATKPLSMGTWFHVAVVRQGRTIKIYIDGVLEAEATSKTGVANINNNADVRLGRSRRLTPKAQYEDLRIYHTALSDAEIKALVPPVNRPLREGEIELVGADKAAVILNQNIDNLGQFSSSFKQLRVGNNTGVTLYDQPNFGGIAQKCYADLPDMRHSRIKNFPKSIRIWSTVGDPFTGKWMIKAPNGQFLSLGKSSLTTAPQQGLNELFKFHYNLQQSGLQLIPGADQVNDP